MIYLTSCTKAIEKIKYWLIHESHRRKITIRASTASRNLFTSSEDLAHISLPQVSRFTYDLVNFWTFQNHFLK